MFYSESKVNTIPYYKTSLGAAYLGDSLELMNYLPDNSVNLIVTSPPYALTRKNTGTKPLMIC